MWRLVLLILGGVLIYFGIKEWMMAGSASEQPESIALRDLIVRGRAGNPHVVVTDFEVGDTPVCFYTSNKDSFVDVWIPVMPRGGAAFPNRSIPALIMSKRARTKADLDRLCAQPSIQGMVSDIWLTDKRKFKLKESLHIDFSRCIIIEDGRQPAGPLRVIAFLGGGLAALAFGMVLVISSFKKPAPTDPPQEHSTPNEARPDE